MQCLQKLMLAEVRRMSGVVRNEGSLMLSHVKYTEIIDLLF